MTEGSIDDEQRCLRAGKGCLDQIFSVKQIGEKAREKKCRAYVGFMDLEKACEWVNREALWQALRMYDVSCKLLNSIKSVRVKVGESECFRINSSVRQVCLMSPRLFMCIWR